MIALFAMAVVVAATPVPVATMHGVFIQADGTCREARPDELKASLFPAELHHAWIWTDRMAPTVRASADWKDRNIPRNGTPLSVKVIGEPTKTNHDWDVIAAPASMWEEVPEPMLPRWRLRGTPRIQIPRVSGEAWRVRLVGEPRGSGWVEVPAHRSLVTIVPSDAVTVRLSVECEGGATPEQAIARVMSPSDGRRGGGQVVALFVVARGKAELPSVPESSKLSLVVLADGFAPGIISSVATTPLVAKLTPGTELTGMVVGPDERPLPGAKVHVEHWVSPTTPWALVRSTQADASGHWRIKGLPKGLVSMRISLSGFAPSSRLVDLSNDSGELGTIMLRGGLSLPVAVTDTGGNPVPNAVVEVETLGQFTTDNRGTTVIPGLPGDEGFLLTVRAPGFLTATTPIAAPPPEQVRVRLTGAFDVRGMLVRRNGQAVADAEGKAEIGNRTRAFGVGETGRFELTLEPGTPVTLLFLSPSMSECRVSVGPGAEHETRDLGAIEMSEGSAVIGRVTRAMDGSPVPASTVMVPRPTQQGPVIAWMLKDLLRTDTATDGSFRLSGLQRSSGRMRVTAPGFAPAIVPYSFRAGEPDADVGDIPLREGTRVSVRVTGDRGEGAEARLDTGGESLPFDILRATVNQGTAVLENVPAGRAQLTVTQGQTCICEQEITIAESDKTLDVTCQDKPMEVTGTVIVGGEPPVGGTLLWQRGTNSGFASGIMNYTTAFGLRQQYGFTDGATEVRLVIDSDGTFSTEDLRPGSWEVLFFPTAGTAHPPKKVDLPDTSTFQVVLAYDALQVQGVVVDKDGKGVPGAEVTETSRMAVAFSGADGTFRLGGLGPGTTMVSARKGNQASDRQKVMLKDGEEATPVKLVLRPQGEDHIRVFVYARGGAPAPGSLVFIETDTQAQQLLSTDAVGAAAFAVGDPPPSRIRAAAIVAGDWVLGGWRTFDEVRQGLVLTAKPTGTFTIVSKNSEGRLQLVHQLGWDLGWLLARIGGDTRVSPERSLTVGGVPPGPYEVRVGAAMASASIDEGEVRAIKLP